MNTPTTSFGTISSGGDARASTGRGHAHARNRPNLNNQLQLAAANGFLLNLMSGGQLLVNLANSIVFEYSNKGVQVVTPNLTVSFVQPLLRGAWARIVTQGLSLQERNVLYKLRAFAEFRRQFYVELGDRHPAVRVSNSSRLSVPPQSSSRTIRNLEINVKSYQAEPRHLRGGVSAIEKCARCRARSPNQYQRTPGFICFRRKRGFRPRSTCSRSISGCQRRSKCESTIRALDQFELNDERLDNDAQPNRRAVAASSCKAMSFRSPSWPMLARRLQSMYDELEKIHDQVVAELQRWQRATRRDQKQGL